MSKLKGKLAKRIMAIVLSGAMIMSNMSVYAAELAPESETEIVSEAEETDAAETTSNSSVEEDDESGTKVESAETAASTAESSESETEKTEAAATEKSTEDKKDNSDEAESDTEVVERSEEEEIESEKATEEETEAEENTEKQTVEDNKAMPDTYVLEFSSVEISSVDSVPAEEKDIKAGTSEYFTIQRHKNTKTETGKNATFDGNVTISARLSTGGTIKESEASVKFTTKGSADIKVYWQSNADSTNSENRKMQVKKGSDIILTATDEQGTTKGENYILSGTVSDAGTYYVGSSSKGLYIYKIEVTETPASTEPSLEWSENDLQIVKTPDGTLNVSWATAEVKNAAEGDTYTVTYDLTVTEEGKTDKITKTGLSELKYEYGKESGETLENGKKYTFEVVAKAAKTGGSDALETTPQTKEITYTKEAIDETIHKIDIPSEGLKKDKAGGYGDDKILTLTVLEDMPSKTPAVVKVVSGIAWEYEFQATTTNPNPNKGNIPTEGAAFKIEAKADAKIYFVTGAKSSKDWHLVETDGNGKIENVTTFPKTEDAPAGTHVFTLKKGKTYYFYGDGTKITVYGILYQAYDESAARTDWSIVGNPAISKPEFNENGTKRIDVTVDAVVGTKGGDKLTVEMFDSKGDLQDKVEMTIPGEHHVLSFIPELSDDYAFKATLSRANKTDKVSAMSESVYFNGPVKAPTKLTITDNSADGSISVDFSWEAAKGAVGYIVDVKEKAEEGAAEEGKVILTPTKVTDTKITVSEGLEAGKTYVFSVLSVKNENAEENSEPATKEYAIPAAGETPTKTIDLTGGLKAGEKYGDPELVTIEVLADMSWKGSDNADIGGTKYAGCVQGESNASPNKGEIPTSGAAFKITAIKDLTFTFAIGSGENKSWDIVCSDGTKIDHAEFGPASFVKFSMDAGKVYYFYGNGTKLKVYEIAYKEVPAGLKEDINISNGLKKGEVYGTSGLATIEVLEDMPFKDGTIQGSGNPSPNKGQIPTSGAVFKVTAIMDTTVTFKTSPAAGKAWHVVRDKGDGDTQDKPNGTAIGEEIKFNALAGNTYYIYGDGTKLKVSAISMKEYIRIIRTEWGQVAAPVITEVNPDKDGKIEVTVQGNINDYDGDSIIVEMYDVSDPEAKPVENATTAQNALQNNTSKLEFSPSKTGKYYFIAYLTRNPEEDENSASGEEITFASKKSARYPAENGIHYDLPLSPPLISAVTNLGDEDKDGKGGVEVEWTSAKEATGYKIYVRDKDKNLVGDPVTVSAEEKRLTNITGLTVGETYFITASSLKNEKESKECDKAESIVITEDKKMKWAFSASGASISLSNATKTAGHDAGTSQPKNGHYKYGTEDNNFDVEVWSVGGAGKVVPATTDGLSFYYTQLPVDQNFTLTATAKVETWTYSNGQDGFGLMVSDTVGEHGNGDYVWTNCYQNVVSKVEYRWDGEKEAEYSDISKARYSMKIGVGATEKTGATAQDIADIKSGGITQPVNWSSAQYPLDFSATKYPAGEYNIVGNLGSGTPPSGGPGNKLLRTEFDLTLEKNNNGYRLSYTYIDPETGKEMGTSKQFYDLEALNKIEEGVVYVGVFASRNADVTFKNVTIDTTREYPPKDEQPTSYINLATSVLSGSTSNTSDYELIFDSNWSGSLTVKDSEGRTLAIKEDVVGKLDTSLAIYKEGDEERDTKVKIPLSGLEVGDNVFTLIFTPDKNMKNKPGYTELKSYDAVTTTHKVSYRRYGQDGAALYVGPNGKSSGTGTKLDPLDIYTAVKYVRPGQKILLMEGSYLLNNALTIPKGVNGTESKKIYMIADPAAEERPVIDFQKVGKGMTIAGNYWYFKGFDVTRSYDGNDGIKVSGSYNTLDQINAYMNGNTGIQISGSGNDTYSYWPAYNTILNCTSYLNADGGYEDADGFAAKLTTGSGNVFDGCIAAYNADDGWDLFAKIQTGSIGGVTIRNSIAYKNGFVLRADNGKGELSLNGKEVDAGNGNGFKMGGDGLYGGSIYDKEYVKGEGNEVNVAGLKGHILENSIAFENKSKGFDSNSCPNNKIKNSVSFNNRGENIGLYTYNNNKEKGTFYEVSNTISFRTKYTGVNDSISPMGAQIADKSGFINPSTYLWNKREGTSLNSNNIAVSKKWFKSTSFPELKAGSGVPWFTRNEDGSINRGDFLVLDTEEIKKSVESQAADMEQAGITPDDLTLGGTGSITNDNEDLKDLDKSETDGSISAGNGGITDEDNTGTLSGEQAEQEHKFGINVILVGEGETDVKEDEKYYFYTGKQVTPRIRVYLSGKTFTDYTVTYKNNINAYVEGDPAYADIPDEKRPQMVLKLKGAYKDDYIYYFNIYPIELGDSSRIAAADIAVTKPQVPKPELIFDGKKLALGKDFNILKTVKDSNGDDEYVVANKELVSETKDLVLEGIGNYTGETTIRYTIVDDSNLMLMNKAKIKLETSKYAYTGKSVYPTVIVDDDVIKPNADGVYNDKLYKVSVSNNIDIGKGTVMVTALVSDKAVYAGSKSLSFTIAKTPIKIDNVTLGKLGGKDIKIEDQEYTGAAIMLKDKLTVTIDGKELTGAAKGSRGINDRLPDGRYKYDYTYEYKNNVEAGNASLIIKGIHNCSGSATIKYRILPANISTVLPCGKAYTIKKTDGTEEVQPAENKDNPKKGAKGTLEIVYDRDVTYVSSGARAAVSVYYNGNSVSKKNYTVSYKNNKTATSGLDAIITVSWKGSLKGAAKQELNYRISPCELAGNVYVKTINDVFTNGKTSMKKGEFDKSRAVLMNGKTKLANGKDYILEYRYSEKAANGTVKPGVYSTDPAERASKQDIIDIPKEGLDVEVWVKPAGNSNYTGKEVKIANIRVAYFDIAKANIQLLEEVGKDASGNAKYAKAVLYFHDKTSVNDTGLENQLDTKYVKVKHPAYTKSEYGQGKPEFLNYCEYTSKNGDGYTYDKAATNATSAGTQKVTIYGIGLFGGTKVLKYTILNKTYNISKAVVNIPRDTTIPLVVTDTKYKKTSELTPAAIEQIEEQIHAYFDEKAFITDVNSNVKLIKNITLPKLAPEYYECKIDKKDFNEEGKPITVIIKGRDTDGENTAYSGSKKVKVTVQVKKLDSDLSKIQKPAIADIPATEKAIKDGITLNEINFGEAVSLDGVKLVFGEDYEVSTEECIIYETDDKGAYIEDPENGEPMLNDKGNVIKDKEGNPIKYKVLRKYTGYYNNKTASTEDAPSTAYVCIEGIGKYHGIYEVAFTIKQVNDEIMPDEEHLITVEATSDAIKKGITLDEETLAGKVIVNGIELTYEKDYTIKEFKNNKKAGTDAYVTITATGKVQGEFKIHFKIVEKPAEETPAA